MSPVAILVADGDGFYVEANAAAEEIFGCGKGELIGKKISDFTAPIHAQSTAKLWSKFQADGVQVGTIIISRKDGTDRLLRYSARAHFLPGLHLSFLRDITGES